MIQKDSRAALAFIFITVLIDTIGFSIVLPVIPNLILDLTQVDVSQASLSGGWLAFAYAITQFIATPCGAESSRRAALAAAAAIARSASESPAVTASAAG